MFSLCSCCPVANVSSRLWTLACTIALPALTAFLFECQDSLYRGLTTHVEIGSREPGHCSLVVGPDRRIVRRVNEGCRIEEMPLGQMLRCLSFKKGNSLH